MTSHELARWLLDHPDAPVCIEDTYGTVTAATEATWHGPHTSTTTIYLETQESGPGRRLGRVEQAAQKTVNAYEAYGFGPAVEHRVRLLRATLEARS